MEINDLFAICFNIKVDVLLGRAYQPSSALICLDDTNHILSWTKQKFTLLCIILPSRTVELCMDILAVDKLHFSFLF